MKLDQKSWEQAQQEELTKLGAGNLDINFRFRELHTNWEAFGSWHFEFQHPKGDHRVLWDGKEKCLSVEAKAGDGWKELASSHFDQPPETYALWLRCKRMLAEFAGPE